jgi:hypothetical protein
MAQQKIIPNHSLAGYEKDETQRRHLRLCYLFILTIWTFAAIASPFVVFCLTKNPESFYGFSSLVPPIFLWAGFAKFVLMDERRFELERMRLENGRGETINSF